MPKLTHGERQQQAAEKLEKKRLRREARDLARTDRANHTLNVSIKKHQHKLKARFEGDRDKANARFEQAKANGRVAVLMDPASLKLKINLPAPKPPKPPKPTLPVRSNYASWNAFEEAVHSQAEKIKLILPPKRKEETRGVERVTSHEREAM